MSELPAPRLEGAFDLGGRRRIGFAEYGPVDGDPIFWFHGTPGARRQIPPATRVGVHDHNVRLIVLERPGIGASTPHAYDTVAEWAVDVEVIADRLGLARFGVIALSGGGPYALACAHALPRRVVAAGIIGGVCPAFGPDASDGGVINFFRPFGRAMDLVHLPVGMMTSALVTALKGVPALRELAVDLFMRISPEGDQRVFARPEMREMFVEDLLRGSRRGVLSVTFDARLFLRDWGFSMRDIPVPVRWWHGDADQFVPLEHARRAIELIPDAALFIRPGESHLGGLDAASEIIDSILSLWPEHVEPVPLRATRREGPKRRAAPSVGSHPM